MKSFDYTKIPEKLLTPELVQMMGWIHKHKEKQIELRASLRVISVWKNW